MIMTMANMWDLTENGFIQQFLIAGPVERDFFSQETAIDQLTLEGILRGQLDLNEGIDNIKGAAWRVYAPCKADMIDVSAFYSTLKTVSLAAQTYLYADEEMCIKARLWTYMKAALFCNGKEVGRTDRAVYKPIEYVDVELKLRKGKNSIYAVCSNLCARDSRNILGIQILYKNKSSVHVALFEGAEQKRLYDAWKYLNSIRIEASAIVSDEREPEGAYMMEALESPDYEVCAKHIDEKVPVGKFKSAVVKVGVETSEFKLERTVEDAEKRKPEYDRDVFRATADITSNNRGEFGFSMPNILARLELGISDLGTDGVDRNLLFNTLDLIEKRVDCADFELCGLFRLLHLHGDLLDEEVMGRVKEVVLGFRYWMSMKGSDAMCFWSENHSLMFYMCAYEAGRMYPDEYFELAKMSGRELFEFGKKNLEDWIRDVEEYGFEEFLSSVYLNVTFAVLLNVVDFTDENTSKRVVKILDDMFIHVAKHCFKECMIAPMGRVYRGNIYPFAQGIQETLRMFDKTAPGAYGEGWGAFIHGSKYRFPDELVGYMRSEQDEKYETGNAEIVLKKTADYCLTSVQSPCSLGKRRWENVRLKALSDEMDANVATEHIYTKSLNESFHGTSYFEPGTYGYQQHMWYAALSPEAVIFINHPGVSNEESDMRPGYWFGNGVMPALRQQGNVLGGIYKIPDEHPVGFVHMYLPEKRFDDVCEFEDIRSVIGASPFGTENATVKSNGEGNSFWLFLRKADGYMAIWCSEKPYKYSDMIFDSELRIASRNSAYVVICGSKAEDGSYEDFRNKAVSFAPYYDKNCGKLFVSGTEFLKYEKGIDRTQYVI